VVREYLDAYQHDHSCQMSKPKPLTIHAGMDVPKFQKGPGHPSTFSAADMNVLRGICQAFAKLQVPGGSFTMSEENAIITFNSSGSNTANTPFFHPFRIYNVPSPVPGVARWRCWQVRGGYLGWRSRFSVLFAMFGQEQLFTVNSGTDQITGQDTAVGYDYFSPSTTLFPVGVKEAVTVPLGTVGDPGDVSSGVSTYGHAATFILSDTLDDFGAIQASFWIQVIDDGTNFKFDIRCRRWGEIPLGASAVRDPYPGDDEYIIPLGLLLPRGGIDFPSDPTDLVVEQLTANHLSNRWTQNIAWIGAGGARFGINAMNWRGFWDDIDTYGLAGQVYYQDDCVTTFDQITDSNGDTFFTDKTWIRFGQPAIVNDAPDVDGTNWTALGEGV